MQPAGCAAERERPGVTTAFRLLPRMSPSLPTGKWGHGGRKNAISVPNFQIFLLVYSIRDRIPNALAAFLLTNAAGQVVVGCDSIWITSMST